MAEKNVEYQPSRAKENKSVNDEFEDKTRSLKSNDEQDAHNPGSSSSTTRGEEEMRKTGSEREQIIAYTSPRSLTKWWNEIQEFLNRNKPVIVALSDTRLNNAIDDDEINIPGYVVVRCDGDTRKSGGVAFYIKRDVVYKVLPKISESSYWLLAIEVTSNSYTGVIMVVYHPSSNKYEEFIKDLLHRVRELKRMYNLITVVGDFSINCSESKIKKDETESKTKIDKSETKTKIDESKSKKEIKMQPDKKSLLNAMGNIGMVQYVKETIRIKEENKTIIDLIFSNRKVNVILDRKDATLVSGHAWLKFSVEQTEEIGEKFKNLSVQE